MPRKNPLRFAAACAAFLLAPVCWSQTAPAPLSKTASAGVRPEEVEAAVTSICPSHAVTRSKDGSVSGCRRCPQGTDFSGVGTMSWGLYAVTPGHFTSPQDDNLLLDGSGCDSHANNFGGSFMFTLKSGKPRLLHYDQGLVTSQCHKFAFSDGRDFLVCQGGWTGQGENIAIVSMSSFDPTGKDVTTILFTTTDTTFTCGDDPTTVVQESDIKDLKFSSKESGEITGMTITAILGDVKCSQLKSEQKTGKLSASVKTYQIEFVFDGKRFKVAPASRAVLNRFKNN